GFVGFVVPYAFCIAALATRQLGDTWIRTTRRWTMFAWLILGIGILLGGFWAYHELGWGGFWAWDPVENASLMPWLIGTAFLHSVMVQEKKGMLKIWNVVLVIMAYTMSIFGTFLTRSGFIQSVHAFAQSPVGYYFLAFIVLALSYSLYLLFDRLDYLKSEAQMDAVVSRESSFLFNNLLLLAACFAVLWGTVFPVLSQWATDQEVTLKGPWFNSVMVPIAIALMFLTGVGPLLAWRKASTNSLKRNFAIPGVIALASGVALYFWGVRHFYAWMSLVMSIFVAATIVREFFKGARARSKGTAESLPQAVINLTLGNTRRYGGYIAHFGFVLLFVGWAGQAFTRDIDFDLGVGETFAFDRYVFRVEKLGVNRNPNYVAQQATVGLYEKASIADSDSSARLVATMQPEKRMYLASQTPTTEVAIRSTPREDVYLVFQESSSDGAKARLKAYLNPLVMWVWSGGIVLALGTLIALLPNRKTLPSRRVAREGQAEENVKEGSNVETVHQ
ncbi:MAG TPA: cytochrome c-type biogenesis CcmF C-terminal domain-containing protein, partial [Terriglobia bacterium]|nr:cytochrome c-type biogenesis CcmF C-terminal domain-containing protein [Terriglobia bacterium]